MTLGILANSTIPSFGNRAGGNVHFLEVAKRLTSFDVVIFAPDFIAEDTRRRVPSARVVEMPSVGGILPSKLAVFAYTLVSWVKRYAALRRCDVLLASSHFLSDVIPALFSKGRRWSVVIHHIVEPPWQRRGNYMNNAIAYVMERVALFIIRFGCRLVFVDTASMVKELRRRGFRQPILIAGNAMVVPPVAVELAGRRPVVAYLGRLSPTKGLEDLLRAWALTVHRVDGVMLEIAGDGPPEYRAELEQLASDLGIAASVQFLGTVSEDEKWKLFLTSSVFAFPSHEEGWGIVIAEAMSCGLPCVTYDLAIYDQIFTGGRLSAALGDTDAFADALVHLLSSEDERIRVASAAHTMSRAFSWDNVAQIEQSALLDVFADHANCTEDRR